MKKFIALTLSTIMMCSSVFAGDISVNLNGENVEFANQVPVIIEGRTLIPLRGVFEKLGYEISWENETKSATFSRENTVVKVTVNANSFTVNDGSVNLDVPAQIVNGSMMLPLRAVGEATGLKVDWDNENKVVMLSSNLVDVEDTTVKTTETTTETTTEKATETTTAKISESQNRAYADGYINYTKSAAFISSYSKYMLSVFDVISEQNGDGINYDVIIEINNICKNKVSKFTKTDFNKESLSQFNKWLEEIDSLAKLYKSYKSAGKLNSYTAKQEIATNTQSFVDEYNNLKDVMEKQAESYSNSIKDINWSEDDLTDTQVKEARAFQKKIGEIIDKYMNNSSVNKDSSYYEISKELKRISTAIRKEVSAVTPPDFAISDKYIMLNSCNILDEASNIFGKNIDKDAEGCVNMLEVESLLFTFECCAKTCAGDYYIAATLIN
ncbi:MAG: copper amine oxidase N-terminal domain-containing protein [Lachnospirales bacterium]